MRPEEFVSDAADAVTLVHRRKCSCSAAPTAPTARSGAELRCSATVVASSCLSAASAECVSESDQVSGRTDEHGEKGIRIRRYVVLRRVGRRGHFSSEDAKLS